MKDVTSLYLSSTSHLYYATDKPLLCKALIVPFLRYGIVLSIIVCLEPIGDTCYFVGLLMDNAHHSICTLILYILGIIVYVEPEGDTCYVM